ncbi:hypothetical protein BDW22DRAFT_11000 [Trametopsis cervina]|nr:hypothetical protein BDW22DRAFT_11000 [Trametopsis cervina]
MLANYPTTPAQNQKQRNTAEDPFVVYARSLHEYTLQLWTESIRMAQERKQLNSSVKAERKAREERRRRSVAEQKGMQSMVSAS